MKKAFVWILLSGIILFSHAQEWTMIHPYPTLSNLIDVHFINDDEGWIVGTEGTIMHTSDAGVSWETQHSDPDESFWSIYFINDQEGWVCGWSSIYHTDDGGENWIKQLTPGFFGDFRDVFFINSDTGWLVGTYQLIMRTTDGGENWTKIRNVMDGHKCFNRLDFYDDNHGCAVGGVLVGSNDAFMMITDDGGLNWTETTPPNTEEFTDVDYFNDMGLWTCGDNGAFRSIDGGSTWLQMHYGNFDAIHFFDDTKGILLNGNHVNLSFDGGLSWDSTTYINPFLASFHALTSWDVDKIITVGYNGDISRSTNGGSNWEKVNQGLPMPITEIGFFDSYNGFGICGYWTIAMLVTTNDGGYSWQYSSLNGNGRFYNMYMVGQSCYLINGESQLMKTYDGGINWELSDIPSPENHYSDVQFVTENAGFLCGYGGECFKTSNGGNDWENISPDTSGIYTKIFFSDELHGWLINHEPNEVLRTNDGGESWIPSTMIYMPIDIFFTDNNTGYLTTEDGFLYKTFDGGENWESISNLSGLYSKIYFVSNTEGWFSNGSMIYHTYDGGLNWSEGEYITSLRSIYFLDEDQGWLGGTDGLVAIYEGSVGFGEKNKQEEFVTVYPNPARDIITITYPEAQNKPAEVTIYNVSGQIITQQIINSDGTLTLDISEIPAGIYLLRINTIGNHYSSGFVIR